MSLKPWREIAQPHKDVLEGTFKQSEFAADISQVAAGTAPAEYQDAEKFSYYPGAKRLDAKTVRFEADDYYEVKRFFMFAI